MKKRLFLISIFFLLLIVLVPTFGRYVGKEIKNYYLISKNFYFNADKLEQNGIVYQVENWSGVDSYDVIFNLDSYLNNSIYSKTDIEYEITYSCSDNVKCDINKTSGIIYSTKHTDSFTITINPIKPLEDGEKATIEVQAKSISPYEKTLKGKFNVVVGKMGLTYEILDKKNSTYFEVAVTNTLDYYVARETYSKYEKGTKIDIDTYLKLPEEEKQYFASSIVAIDFSPEEVLLDMTSTAYLNAISTNTKLIDNKNYINNISFKVDALSSYRVKFYKVDSTKDYTYPFNNNSSIVDVKFD